MQGVRGALRDQSGKEKGLCPGKRAGEGNRTPDLLITSELALNVVLTGASAAVSVSVSL
jgi:hypothetical protein